MTGCDSDYISTPISISMSAMIALNCLVYGCELSLLRIFPVEADPSKTVGVLRKKIWEENPELRNLDPTHLVLYTPKKSIPTASEAEFKQVFVNMNLIMQSGRNSALELLIPTRKLERYDGLSNPVEEDLHIIVFPSEGRCRCLDYLSSY